MTETADEHYIEENTELVDDHGLYHVVEKSFYPKILLAGSRTYTDDMTAPPFKIRYFRSETILMIDWDDARPWQVKLLLIGICALFPSHCYRVYKTVGGYHATLMSDYSDAKCLGMSVTYEAALALYQGSCPAYWEACGERESFGYRLTPKQEHENDYVAHYLYSVGTGDEVPEIAEAMDAFESLLPKVPFPGMKTRLRIYDYETDD